MTGGLRARSIVAACGVLWVAVGGLAAETAPAWPRLPPLPAGPCVLLAGGGILAGDLVAADDDSLTIDAPACGVVTLPRSAVSGFRASRAVSPRAAAALAGADDQPAIVMTNGDAACATALAARDGEVVFTTRQVAAAAVRLPLARVLAIDFPLRPAAPPRGPWVALSDGSRLARSSLPAACGADEIVASTPDDVDVQFLAALSARAEGPPWSHDVWPTARGTTAFTAVTTHAAARLTFQPGRPAGRFSTAVAIADSAGQGGSVVVRIRSRDAKGKFRDVFTSPIIRGGDEPLAIDVAFAGAAELELVVEEADVGTVLDRTIWLDPRITR